MSQKDRICCYMVSLGCCKNLVDAENMLGLLKESGYRLTGDPAEADVIVVNTCGFIDSAKQESIDVVLELARYKEEGRCRLLVVTGCLAERYRTQFAQELPEVDLVLGAREYGKVARAIAEKLGRDGQSLSAELDFRRRIVTTPFYTAYLKIAEGCDNHCTYCVIPKIRGPYKSRPMEELIEEARQLADGGVRELIVVAQDTTRYGLDLAGKPLLAALLNALCTIEGIEWVRVHYTYPEMLTDEMVETMARQEKIVHYLDIPVQHSEDDILRRMGRRSTRSELLALFEKLRQRMPDIVLRTSIIVGFPGETEEQFKALCEFVRQVRFDRLGVFPYSQEEGTPAARLPDQIPEEEKRRRYDVLMQLQQGISLAKNREKVGKRLLCLVEAFDTVSERHIGRTYGDSLEIDNDIYFTASRRYDSGEFVLVDVVDAEEYSLYGVAVEG